jgi:hypothetical protein
MTCVIFSAQSTRKSTILIVVAHVFSTGALYQATARFVSGSVYAQCLYLLHAWSWARKCSFIHAPELMTFRWRGLPAKWWSILSTRSRYCCRLKRYHACQCASLVGSHVLSCVQAGEFSSVLDCLVKVYQTNGVRGFYRVRAAACTVCVICAVLHRFIANACTID